jgi:hypothetical protein
MRSHLLLLLPILLTVAVAATARANVDCKMKYSMSGWSAIYQKASGHGHVTCNNGQSADVTLRAQGGGSIAGKMKIDDGTGDFTGAKDMSELFGTYARAEAAAGAVKAGEAQVLTNGPITLTLAGKGRGWELGVAAGDLVIEKAPPKKTSHSRSRTTTHKTTPTPQ